MTHRSLHSNYLSPVSRLVLAAGLALTVSGCNWVKLTSVSSTGEQANATSTAPSISANGRYIAFASLAGNLVADDTNGTPDLTLYDVFVHDTITGTTVRASVDSDGNEGPFQSHSPSISGDGRYIAFYSENILAAEATLDGFSDIYVHDLITHITTLVSVDSAGNAANGDSTDPSISSDGRYVAFASLATNLDSRHTSPYFADIYVHDRNTATTTLVSVDSVGNTWNGGSSHPAVSGNGRYVAFVSVANNIVAGDTNLAPDVFVLDRNTGMTTLASINPAGNQFPGQSFTPSISDDGSAVAFVVAKHIFVRDLNTLVTTEVSVDSDGIPPNGQSDNPSMSGDGRYVAFDSTATNLVAGDINNKADVFVHDRNTATTSRVSRDAMGAEANKGSSFPSISSNGRYTAFSTSASNLVAGDINGYTDIVVRAVPELNVTSVVPDHLSKDATTAVTITGANFMPGAIPYVGNAKLTNIVVVNENTITVDVYVQANRPTGAQNVSVSILGTGAGPFTGAAGFCQNCVTFF